MKIGIGLPTTIPGAPADLVLPWAQAADAGPFSCVAVVDRVVYPSYEPLIALAAVAGVTHRVRLVTSILQAPLRNATLLAKQASTLDALSGGRLTLGLGVGGRGDDYHAVSAPFADRGRRLDAMMAQMRQIWSGAPLGDGVGAVGPAPHQPGGPEVLFGGYVPASIRRVGRWGDGYLHEGPPAEAAELYGVAQRSWDSEGRTGRPRFVGSFYFGLGPDAQKKASAALADYYGFALKPLPETASAGIRKMAALRAPTVEEIIKSPPSTPEAVRAVIQGCLDVGMDEVIALPAIAELDQVHRLAEVVSGMAGVATA